MSPLDRYLLESESQTPKPATSVGSLYDPSGRLADLARDTRAAQLYDLVTIVIYDKASALSKGATTTSRKSSASASISAMGGPLKTPGPLSSLANLGGANDLQGQGETSRETELKTTLSARVTHVLPNGNLIVEGSKDVFINSERQKVSIRGILRWKDLTADNRVSSDRLSDLEIRVDGRGVVNDAIRRPNFLYRLILGLLPF
ncbi:flagellar basal body L-ring protein FlgH [uncultured Paludibaculum sp.]|uniref:flagellar basal body L-ring protein FlgH n=1 Tax=uncultured Paludibaculum sp. TaxID=1765020 RepID=UPI002AAA7B8A|nr:flagellar basal body L-ring protein FlgH [uncultured Paludibaculum sp.]